MHIQEYKIFFECLMPLAYNYESGIHISFFKLNKGKAFNIISSGFKEVYTVVLSCRLTLLLTDSYFVVNSNFSAFLSALIN